MTSLNPRGGPVGQEVVRLLTDKETGVWNITGLAQGQDPRVK